MSFNTVRSENEFLSVRKKFAHLAFKQPNLWAVLNRFLEVCSENNEDWIRHYKGKTVLGNLIYRQRRYKRRLRGSESETQKSREAEYSRVEAIKKYKAKKAVNSARNIVHKCSVNSCFKKTILVRRRRWVFEFLRAHDKASKTAVGALQWQINMHARARYADLYLQHLTHALPSNDSLEKVRRICEESKHAAGVIGFVGSTQLWPRQHIMTVKSESCGHICASVAAALGVKNVAISSSAWTVRLKPLSEQEVRYRFTPSTYVRKADNREVTYTDAQAEPSKHRYVPGVHQLSVPCQVAVGPSGDAALGVGGKVFKLQPAAKVQPGHLLAHLSPEDIPDLILFALSPDALDSESLRRIQGIIDSPNAS